MRVIGHLPDEISARKFGEVLWSKSIHNEVEADDDGRWMIWVVDEDQLDTAKAELGAFDPAVSDEEFVAVARQAKTVRDELAEQEKKARQVRTRRDLFTDMRPYGVGPITIALIAVCVLVTFLTEFGTNKRSEDLYIEKISHNPASIMRQSFGLSRVKSGEVWRLITPVFMHGSFFHVFFNCWWLMTFGAMIEARKSPGYLMALVVISGVLSNLLQYAVDGPLFLGFSGVNYALFGYLWMKGRYAAQEGMGLPKPTVIFLLAWFFLCFTDMLGAIANWAHAGGLIVGVVWGVFSSPGALREICGGR